MNLPNKIGVMVDSFRIGVRDGLKKAKDVGAEGVQIYAVSGELDPANMSQQARKELKSYIEGLGLEIAALCGDLGGHGFQDRLANAEKVEKSKRILDLAADLGTDIVTTHIGIVPDDPNEEIYDAMHQACQELSEYATSMNRFFAIETGPETAAHLKSFLDTLGSKGVSVNFDPANMVMVTGDDPVQGLRTLKDYIVHTHVKDGIKLRDLSTKEVYGYLGYEAQALDHDHIAAQAASGPSYREVPLGEGKVDFPAYFAAIQEIGYKGYLTIEREVDTDPEGDIRKAVQFIKAFK